MWGTRVVECKILEKKDNKYLIEFYDDNIEGNIQRWVKKDKLRFPEFSEYIV
jgi:hypothetical protein